MACDSVELKARGDLPCGVGTIDRRDFSRMCGWRSGYRRIIRCGRSGALADEALASLTRRFEGLYSTMGRPSIPPEMLLRATLLQAFFSVRSERLLMEPINYNLLFRWFVGMPMDAAVWHATVFTHNRDRLLEAEVAHEFLAALLALPRVKKLLSIEHFSVDGTLIDAWASMKSFRCKDGSGEPPSPGRNGERNFHKEKRSNE